jgi:hypothetical protein
MFDFLDKMLDQHMMPTLYVCFFILMLGVGAVSLLWQWAWKKFITFIARETPAWLSAVPLKIVGFIMVAGSYVMIRRLPADDWEGTKNCAIVMAAGIALASFGAALAWRNRGRTYR